MSASPENLPLQVSLAKPRHSGIILAITSLVFVWIGVQGGERRLDSAWMIVLMFSVFAIAAFVSVLPGAFGMRLDPLGFETRSWFRARRARWSECAEFRVRRDLRKPAIVFDYILPERRAGKGGPPPRPEGVFQNMVDRPLDDVAALMNAFRLRALEESASRDAQQQQQQQQ